MRIIKNVKENNSITKNELLNDNHEMLINIPIDIFKNINSVTKDNVFPDKYIYKHNWLLNGYKTTYKKDFIKHD